MRDSGIAVDPAQVGEGVLSEEQLIYKENIIDHYKHPHNKKAIDNPTVKKYQVNPSCGDSIEVALIIKDDKIADVGFQGKGCAISQASMSMLSDKLKGMDVSEAQKLQREDILEMIGIPVGVVRMKCAMLGLRTTQEALK
jgi:nitrogen fixation protein NifU and related proteins